MGSSVLNSFTYGKKRRKSKSRKTEHVKPNEKIGEEIMSEFDDEFYFVDAYSEDVVEDTSELLPENSIESAIDCAFIGVGGEEGN